MLEPKEIIGQLTTEFNISKELIADKLGVSSRTIERWLNGEIIPGLAAKKILNQILNGYKSQNSNEG